MSEEKETQRRAAWLVEAAGPHYLATTKLRHQFYWDPNASCALQLATEAQANALRDAVRDLRPGLFPECYPMPKATEHIWMGDEPERVPASDIAALKAEVERLTRERDDAWQSHRAELESRRSAEQELALLQPVAISARALLGELLDMPPGALPGSVYRWIQDTKHYLDALSAEPPKGSGTP